MSRTLRRGPEVLRQLLAERLFDLREQDVNGFRVWLEQHLPSWGRDPVFLQRARIRDLRRAHPELRELERSRERALLDYEASPLHAAIEGARRELAGADNAVAGLTHALRTADRRDERERLTLKLDEFRGRAEALRGMVAELTRASAERLALDGVAAELERVREQHGFNREAALLERLQRTQGRSSGRSGAAFEAAASEATHNVLLPDLGHGSGDVLVVLRGVKLGAARTEIDQLVVRSGGGSRDPVETVALIEAKRNPNDLAHGLSRRLENLAWLAGHRDGYDAEGYRTATSPSGHFEGEATHLQDGVRYRFDRASFNGFLDDLVAGRLPANVYLITRSASLWGIGSAGLGRIAHRVASDAAWDPEDQDYLSGLLRWCQGLAAEVESPDLIRRFAADPAAARQLLLLEE